jgi:hypothetical protein
MSPELREQLKVEIALNERELKALEQQKIGIHQQAQAKMKLNEMHMGYDDLVILHKPFTPSTPECSEEQWRYEGMSPKGRLLMQERDGIGREAGARIAQIEVAEERLKMLIAQQKAMLDNQGKMVSLAGSLPS